METPATDPSPQVPYSNLPDEHHDNDDESKGSSKQNQLFRVGFITMSLLAVVLLILVLVFASRAFINQNKIDEALKKGQEEGTTAQKAFDAEQLAKTQNSDLRTYTAPEAAGSFRVNLPKSWSLAVTPDDGTNTISALAMPDFVDTKLTQYALRFALIDKKFEDVKKQQDKKGSSSEVIVSGIKGTQYTGAISNKVTNGTLIIVPLRDKTFSIQTDDNAKYLDVYNAIVGNLHLNP